MYIRRREGRLVFLKVEEDEVDASCDQVVVSIVADITQ